MRKNISVISVIGLSLGLVACATSEQKPTASQTQVNADRRIAGQATIEYTTDTRPLPKVCGHAPQAQISEAPNQIVLTSRQEMVTRYTVRTPVYACETSDGNGKGDWAGFYDQSGDKAKMLNEAIKGVGKTVAPYLVPYFQQGKPRSWRAFADLITGASKEIQRSTGISPGWASAVLYQYKADNMERLGYISASGCAITGYLEQTYEDRAFIADLAVVVETRIRGSKLLPGECDNYTVSWNGREVTGAASSDYNHYNVTTNYDQLTADRSNGRKAIVTYKGERVAVAPGYLMEIPGSTAVASGGSVQITVRNAALNAMMGVPEFANSCKMSASVVIYGRKGSAWSSSKSAAVKSASFPLNAEAGSTTYTVEGAKLAEGQHPVVKISTAFAPGCPFFSAASIDNGTIEE